MNWRKRADAVKAWLAGCRDSLLNKNLMNRWGGPFNGQKIRQTSFSELAQLVEFNNAIETGTFLGDTTEFLASNVNGILYSIEREPYYAAFAKTRFLLNSRIAVRHGDSRFWLQHLLKHHRFRSGVNFFYLDAHWTEDLPLAEELDLIFGSDIQAVVMVDDFQVMDDPDYEYDDYGPNKILNLEYIKKIVTKHSLVCFFPTAKGADETGKRRGCVLIAPEILANKIQHLKSFRA